MYRLQLLCRRALAFAATLASLVIAPAAGADAGVTLAGDPLDLAALLADAALVGLPAIDPVVLPLPQVVLPVVLPVEVAPPPVPAPTEAVSPLPPVAPAVEPVPEPLAVSASGLAPEAVAAVPAVAVAETDVPSVTPPTPPPPELSQPAAGAAGAGSKVADASPASAAGVPVPEPQLKPAPPQYQPAQPQYQPPESASAQAAPAAAAAGSGAGEWNWDWTWSCGGSRPVAQPPSIPGDASPKSWNWNWNWNCGSEKPDTEKGALQVGTQYHGGITRYHFPNVNISIRIASPGDNGPVTQTNVILAAALQPLAAVGTAVDGAVDRTIEIGQAPPSVEAFLEPVAVAHAEAPPQLVPTPSAAATARLGGHPRSRAAERPTSKPSSPMEVAEAPSFAPPVAAPLEVTPWATTPVVSRPLQPAATEAHRGRTKLRPQLRRPTRRSLPPLRAPVLSAGSFGAAPLGGSDGGFQLALLLVPFALALVDSVRRTVRDTAPPVASEHGSRRERPG